MQLCRFILTPQSPWSSRLRSDTLYGLICWHVAENNGDKACSELVQSFLDGKPSFLISSTMPAYHIPMPLLPPLRRGKFLQLAMENEKSLDEEESLFRLLQRYKKFRKNAWIPFSAWQKHRKALSAEKLFVDYLQEDVAEEKKYSKTGFAPHVSIDRSTGRVMDGQLFFTRLHYFDDDACFHLYAAADKPEELLGLLNLIGETGFGQRASAGSGRFKAEPDPDFNSPDLAVEDSDAGMLLGVCASSHMQAASGFYKLDLKRGKTGPGNANPFKRPFLMFQEGSLLKTPPSGPYVLQDINPDSRIVQILQPLSLPCRLKAEEEKLS